MHGCPLLHMDAKPYGHVTHKPPAKWNSPCTIHKGTLSCHTVGRPGLSYDHTLRLRSQTHIKTQAKAGEGTYKAC